MRELENRVSDLSEDLEAERAAHKRTDKLKRDLNEVSEKYAVFLLKNKVHIICCLTLILIEDF